MSKRLTECGKWADPWFMKLTPQAKLVFLYILDNCDFIGVYEYNEELLRVQMGFTDKVNVRNHIKELEGKVEWFNDGVKIWIVNFIKVQYGVLKEKSSIHKSVLKGLKKYSENEKNGVKFSCFLKAVNQLITSVHTKNSLGYVYPIKKKKEHVFKKVDLINDLEFKQPNANFSKNENEKKFCQFPSDENLEIKLPIEKESAAKEIYKIRWGADLTTEQIFSFWHVFKVQNFTGKKFYADVGDIFSHFINWIKTQKIEKNGTGNFKTGNDKLGTSAARIKAAKEWGRN